MAKTKQYQVVITKPTQVRYQCEVLNYLVENFSLDRAVEIDEKITREIASLSFMPNRGKAEELLKESHQNIKFILYKETRSVALKILYYVNEMANTVYVTDIFPMEMDPKKMELRS